MIYSEISSIQRLIIHFVDYAGPFFSPFWPLGSFIAWLLIPWEGEQEQVEEEKLQLVNFQLSEAVAKTLMGEEAWN